MVHIESGSYIKVTDDNIHQRTFTDNQRITIINDIVIDLHSKCRTRIHRQRKAGFLSTYQIIFFTAASYDDGVRTCISARCIEDISVFNRNILSQDIIDVIDIKRTGYIEILQRDRYNTTFANLYITAIGNFITVDFQCKGWQGVHIQREGEPAFTAIAAHQYKAVFTTVGQ